jgi:hypothetical protein
MPHANVVAAAVGLMLSPIDSSTLVTSETEPYCERPQRAGDGQNPPGFTLFSAANPGVCIVGA